MLAPLAYVYFLFALLAAPVLTQAPNPKDDTTSLYIPSSDGVVLVSGKQTSCAVALISNVHGLAAANCVTEKDGKQIPIGKLSIAMHGASVSQVVTVGSVVVHPNYNNKTLANNIAVIVFSIDGSTLPNSSVSPDITQWDDSCLVRRTLIDTAKPTWNNMFLTRYRNTTDDLCKVSSPIFAANSGAFLCNNAVIHPNQISSCNLPYGLGYGAIKDKGTSPIAIYSHTVVYGKSLCGQDPEVNYYTLLRNYMAWASSTAAAQAKVLFLASSKNVVVAAGDTNYQMDPPTSLAKLMRTYGGDLYRYLPTPDATSTAPQPKPSAVTPGPSLIPSSSSSSGASQDSDSCDTPTPTGSAASPSGSGNPLPTSNTDGTSSSKTTVLITTKVTVTTYTGCYSSTPTPGGTVDCSYFSSGNLFATNTNGCRGPGGSSDDSNINMSFSNYISLVSLPPKPTGGAGNPTPTNSRPSGTNSTKPTKSTKPTSGSETRTDSSNASDSNSVSNTGVSSNSVSNTGVHSDSGHSSSKDKSSAIGSDSNSRSDVDNDSSSVSNGDSAPNTSPSTSGGISRTTAILVGVLVPLAIIIIITCLVLYFKKK